MSDKLPARIPRPHNEWQRLQALARYRVLEAENDPDFDLLARAASSITGAPYAFISMVDCERVWYKAKLGMEVAETPRDEDYCSLTILEHELLYIPDLHRDARTANMRITRQPPYFRMYCGANLRTSDDLPIGTLCVLDTKPGRLHESQLKLLVGLTRQVMSLLELRVRDRELAAALAQAQQAATEDVLTGLRNRRALTESLESEFERARRYDSDLAVLLLDLDHFKAINDGHGHAAGDAVLRGVGQLLRRGVRSIDVAGRYGGEELCVVCPGTDAVGALRLAENLREAIAGARFEEPAAELQATTSIGVASLGPHMQSADSLLRAADRALYQAKQGGRNRVVLAERGDPGAQRGAQPAPRDSGSAGEGAPVIRRIALR